MRPVVAAALALAATARAPAARAPTALAPVHVALAADRRQYAGFAAVVNSARAHSAAPRLLRFHVIVLAGEEGAARAFLRCRGVSLSESRVRVVGFDASRVRGLVRVADRARRAALSSALNYARFFLPELLPRGVRAVAYVDVDVVVLGDLGALLRRTLPRLRPPELAAAVPRAADGRAEHTYQAYAALLPDFRLRTGGRSFDVRAAHFNGGVLLLDLRAWARANLTAEAEWWLARHAASSARAGLWRLGSQPPLHLVLAGRWAALPAAWNVDGLGGTFDGVKRRVPRARLEAAQLLHWSGPTKPWDARPGRHYAALWAPHAGAPACGVRGRGPCKPALSRAREPPCACAPERASDPLCDTGAPIGGPAAADVPSTPAVALRDERASAAAPAAALAERARLALRALCRPLLAAARRLARSCARAWGRVRGMLWGGSGRALAVLPA